MDNLAYFARRARQEEQAVRDATCEEARHRHEELAQAYQLRVRLLSAAHQAGTVGGGQDLRQPQPRLVVMQM